MECGDDKKPKLADLQPLSADDPVIVVQPNEMSGFTPRDINTIIHQWWFLMQSHCVWDDELSARKNIGLAWFSPEFMHDNC